MESQVVSLATTAGTSIAGVATGGWLMRFFIGRQLKTYDEQFQQLRDENKEMRTSLASISDKLNEFMLTEAREGRGLITRRECETCRQQCEHRRDKDIEDLVSKIDRLTDQLEGLTGFLIKRGESANGGPLFHANNRG